MSLPRLIPTLIVCLSLSASSLLGHPDDEGEKSPTQTEVVAIIFLDFYSAPCGEVNVLLDELAKTRQLTIQKLFKHVPAHPDALPSHEAALAAGAQGKFQAMHDLLFKQQKPAGSALLRMAKTLDLDLKRFENALDEREFRHVVIRDIAEARGFGVRTTPTVFLNGTKVEGLDELRSLIQTPARPAPPAWEATPVEPLSLNFEGSPSSGTSNAPVTVVEFTDFRCGFCRIHSQILSELTAAYPGQIYRVFKNYPIEQDGPGVQPHLAALAAMDQGKFWEMHHSIMARPLEPGGDLLERAKSMGMDVDAFQKSLDAAQKRTLIQRDIAEGDQLGIRATPTTFMNGKRMVGRQSLEILKKHVEELLGSQAGVAAGGVARQSPKARGVDKEATSLGPLDASDQIEAFMDLSDPSSAATVALLKDFVKQRPGVRLQFRHFPSQGDPAQLRVHEALMAAAEQRRFWEMCDLILGTKTSVDSDGLKAFASKLGLDLSRFASALQERRHAANVAEDLAEGRLRGLKRSTLFLNGVQFEGTPTGQNLTRHFEESNCCGKAPAPAERATRLDRVVPKPGP